MDSDLQMTLETVLHAPEIRLCYVILRQRLLGICGVNHHRRQAHQAEVLFSLFTCPTWTQARINRSI